MWLAGRLFGKYMHPCESHTHQDNISDTVGPCPWVVHKFIRRLEKFLSSGNCKAEAHARENKTAGEDKEVKCPRKFTGKGFSGSFCGAPAKGCNTPKTCTHQEESLQICICLQPHPWWWDQQTTMGPPRSVSGRTSRTCVVWKVWLSWEGLGMGLLHAASP